MFPGTVGLANIICFEERSMTDDMMIRRTLVEKTTDADLPRDMIAPAAGRRVELEVGPATGAP